MANRNERLGRAVQLWVSRNGAVVAAPRAGRAQRSHARRQILKGLLPFHSTDTMDEADRLVVRFCRLSRRDNETYFLNEFSGEIEDIDRVGLMFEALYLADKKRVAQAS